MWDWGRAKRALADCRRLTLSRASLRKRFSKALSRVKLPCGPAGSLFALPANAP